MRKTFIVLGLFAAMGCGSKKDDSAKKTAEPDKGSATKEPVKEVAKTPDKPKETTPPPAPTGVKVDPEIAKRVKAIVDNCKIDAPSNSISDCKSGEDNEIFNYANTNKDKATGLYESLAEIALTDGAKDPKVLVAIVETWPAFSDHDFEKKASTPAAAERVIKLYDKVNPSSWRWANATRIPLIAGKHAELAAALAKQPEDRADLRKNAYPDFVQFGGMDGLADMQAVVKTSKDEREKGHALQGVGIAVKNHALADADATKACDWVKETASDPAASDDVLNGALDSLSRCGSPYIDAGLTVIEANIKAKHLTITAVDALHHMCWAEGTVGGAMNGSKEQCAKAFSLLEAGVGDKDTGVSALSQSVFATEMLAKNAPELQPKAKALLGKLAANKEKSVADRAKDTLKNLK